MSLIRIRKIYDNDNIQTGSLELDLTNYILYNTDIIRESGQPDETLETANKVLLKPYTDVLKTDWIKNGGLEYKIKNWERINYKGKDYLLKVYY